ncbi:MAG: BglII/BstYI family type II restriction endonuclease [Boseongicola sp.]|nr:BglII/BstYI family type II restriction endonuclease [Boseongicola sp.]
MKASSTAYEGSMVDGFFPSAVREKFEIYCYRGAAAILAQNFSEQFRQVLAVLEALEIDTTMIRMPGGSKGLIAKYVDELFAESDWRETRITADLHVKLLSPQGNDILRDYIREGYLDGHRIDFVNGKVAFDQEWNSKDQTYDRDLYAFSAFHAAGAIDVGILLTRGNSLGMEFMRSLGKVLDKDGDEGTADVYRKFGASTTFMGKLLYRLDAGRNGGCPILALGITPNCVTDYQA